MTSGRGSGSEADSPAMWPIELLHPDGEARSRRQLGSGWPASFGPPAATAISALVDLAVIAPGAADLRDPAFLAAAVELLEKGLHPDGLCLLIAPRWWRRRLLDLLRRPDLRVELALAHLPTPGSERYLAPIGNPGLRFTAGAMVGGRRTLRALAERVPTGLLGLVARSLPTTGFVVRPVGARPLVDWLGEPGLTPNQVVIRYRWGAKGGTAVLFCFTEGGAIPSRVAKVALGGRSSGGIEAEVNGLQALRESAAAAGARVPDAAIVRTRTGRPVLVASYLRGRGAAQLLRAGSIGPAEVLAQVAAWLERWNDSTRGTQEIDSAWLHDHVLAPAGRLSPLLPGAEAYVAWLKGLAERSAGMVLPTVASHNDLTMVNVLLEPGLPPAIVDWEMAESGGLPLADLCYAAVDAVASSVRGSSRAEAFARCFLEETEEGRLIRRLVDRARQVGGLPTVLAPLCFHACWLRHAATEVGVTSPEHPRPFLRILRLLAERPTALRLSAEPVAS